MSEPQEGQNVPYKRKRYPLERGVRQSLEGLPPPEDLAAAAERHKGDDADRFTLYTPEQIERETRNVRLDIAFGHGPNDPGAVIKIRDQAEMIIACMRQIIELTRKHDAGSINQRIECRREAASLGARLTMFNGKTPFGYAKKKPRRP